MDRSDVVTRCVDEILDGDTSLERCIERYPGLRDELTSCLAMARLVGRGRAIISPEFKSATRTRLLTEEQPAVRGWFGVGGFMLEWLNQSRLSRGFRVCSVAMAAVMVVAGSGASMVFASENSLPGDALYSVKIGTENARLTLARAPESKAMLNIRFAEKRVEEAVAQSARGQDVSMSTSQAVRERLDAAINEIGLVDAGKSRNLISQLSESTINQQAMLNEVLGGSSDGSQQAIESSMDASRRGSAVAVFASANPSFLGSSPSVADEGMEQGSFCLEGTLLSDSGGTWNVGGISLANVSVPADAVYSMNTRVTVEGIVRDGKTFISRVDEDEDQDGEGVAVEGVFTGLGADGATWYVSGIPIGKPVDAVVPSGTVMRVEGAPKDGSFVVSRVETSDRQRDVRVSGKVLEVSPDSKKVTIEVAGARIEADIAEANFVSSNGSGQDLSALRTGKDVTLGGLKNKSGVTRASNVSPRTYNAGTSGKDSSGSSSGGSKSGGQSRDGRRNSD